MKLKQINPNIQKILGYSFFGEVFMAPETGYFVVGAFAIIGIIGYFVCSGNNDTEQNNSDLNQDLMDINQAGVTNNIENPIIGNSENIEKTDFVETLNLNPTLPGEFFSENLLTESQKSLPLFRWVKDFALYYCSNTKIKVNVNSRQNDFFQFDEQFIGFIDMINAPINFDFHFNHDKFVNDLQEFYSGLDWKLTDSIINKSFEQFKTLFREIAIIFREYIGYDYILYLIDLGDFVKVMALLLFLSYSIALHQKNK